MFGSGFGFAGHPETESLGGNVEMIGEVVLRPISGCEDAL